MTFKFNFLNENVKVVKRNFLFIQIIYTTSDWG